MGAYPTIARWGIVTGLKKFGKRTGGHCPPYKYKSRPEFPWQKKNLDFTSIPTGKSRPRKRSASWPSRKKSVKPPPPHRPESSREQLARPVQPPQRPVDPVPPDKPADAVDRGSAKSPRQVLPHWSNLFSPRFSFTWAICLPAVPNP